MRVKHPSLENFVQLTAPSLARLGLPGGVVVLLWFSGIHSNYGYFLWGLIPPLKFNA